MEDIYNAIKKNKPNISPNTLKTYSSLLRSLYHTVHPKGDNYNIEWFNNQDQIIKLLETKSPQSRKTNYAALIAICGNDHSDKYKKRIMEDKKLSDQIADKQEKTNTQNDNWKDFNEVKEIHDNLLTNSKKYLNSKNPLSSSELSILQNFIILCLTSGIYFPPRRSTDWSEMKIFGRGDIDKEKDNFMTKDEFVFNNYKTKKHYGTQTVPIPPNLKPILTKWIKLNTNDYLLVDENGNKLNNVKLGHRLNRIFGNKISTSMLRHIYLSDKLKDIPKLNNLQELAKDMGHSVEEQLQYIKHK